MEYNESTEAEFQDENRWIRFDSTDNSNYGYGSDYYFNSYAHFGIHEEMIKDTVRTDTYRKAIVRNPYLFQDKIVLDIGCGTGILSIFAVRAGAKHVYAVDCSDIIDYAQQIVKNNGLQDKITLVKGKIEEIQLPVYKVDIIISEWMGYFLLYESMLNSIIFARDKWLINGGLLFPDRARIIIAALEDEKFKQNKFDFWNDVYGINMTAMRSRAIREPFVDLVEEAKLISTQAPILDIDLHTVTVENLSFCSTFSLHIPKNQILSGIVGWFEVGFFHPHKSIVLNTSPRCKDTHWKQTIFYLNEGQQVEAGQNLYGSFAVRQNPAHNRELDIKISFNLEGNHRLKTWQFYRLT